MKIDTLLKMEVYDLEIFRSECVDDIVIAHEKGDDARVKKAYEEYRKFERLIILGYAMIDAKLENWNWQWAADTGELCDMDWIWFEKQLQDANVSKEEFHKKWKIYDKVQNRETNCNKSNS